MSVSDFLWIFLIIASVQPVIKQRMLEVARVRLLRKIEAQRGSRVIVLIHRQETLSLLGIPISRYIDINDSEQVLRAIKLTDPNVPIDLILHTPGGLVLASEQIAFALCRHTARVTVLVPHYAMSGGTLLAMAADEILMDENAVLGPVDPQLGQFPAASIIKVVEQKKIDEIDDQTLIMADISRKAIKQVKAFVIEILKMNNVPAEKAEVIAEKLSTGTWTHDYPIGASEARELGLPVSAGLPQEVYDLMNLYPQAASRRPSVEYIPMPYPVAPREEEKRPRS
jgi:ClpP class serine protease